MPPQFAKMVPQLPPVEITLRHTATPVVSHAPRKTSTFLAVCFGSLLAHLEAILSPESLTIALKFAFIPTRMAKASRILSDTSGALIGPRLRRHYIILKLIAQFASKIFTIRALRS